MSTLYDFIFLYGYHWLFDLDTGGCYLTIRFVVLFFVGSRIVVGQFGDMSGRRRLHKCNLQTPQQSGQEEGTENERTEEEVL